MHLSIRVTAIFLLFPIFPKSVITIYETEVSNSTDDKPLVKMAIEPDEHVPGISQTRFEVLNSSSKPYEDNKDCLTGQDPFNSAEVKLARSYWKSQREALIDATPPNSIVVMLPGVTMDRMQAGRNNCRSGVCSYDFERFGYVCGRIPQVSYRNGRSCLDGTPPGSNVEKRKDLELQPEPQQQYSGKANQLFGYRCKSKKCYYHYHKDAFLCTSTHLQPIKALLYSAFAIFVNLIT